MGHKKEHKHKKEKKKKDRKRHHSDEELSPERDASSSRHQKKRHKHSKNDESQSTKSSKHRDRDEEKSHKRHRKSSSPKDKNNKPAQHIEVEEVVEYDEEVTVDDASNNNGKSHESLSIEETNKLRAKLGLKPLDVPSSGGAAEGDGEAKKLDFVHKPAEDIWKKNQEEKIREKIRLKKEARLATKKLKNVNTLGEADEVDDISSWVKNSRKIEEKQKREIEITTAASEFGFDTLTKSDRKSRSKQKGYTEKDLQGMEVEHNLSTFKDGKSEILIIKDKEILDEDPEDVLHSVTLQEVEKSKKNLEVKRKGVAYRAYDEEEVDEMGFFKPKTVLGKYDEEIEGEHKGTFTIGESGRVDTTWEQQKEKMKQQIRAQGESLELPQLKVASDYMTAEEIGFKKRKKRVRKIRKRQAFKADDVKPLPGDVQESGNDHGSRASRTQTNDDVIIDDFDDANDELERALAKQRKMKQKEQRQQQKEIKEEPTSDGDETENDKDAEIRRIAEQVRREAELEKQDQDDNKNFFSLNTTDEFCRKLGSQLLSSDIKPMVTSQSDDVTTNSKDVTIHNDDMDIDNSDEEHRDDVTMDHDDGGVSQNNDIADDEPMTSQWRYDVSDPNHEEQEQDHVAIEEEPIAGKGLIGALKLAQRKGYIATELVPKGNTVITTNMSTLKAQNYSIEDKNAVDYLDKYAHEKYSKDRSSRHERGGLTMEFTEKRDYKPNISLNYVDDRGRNQTPKEAFRSLSHRFHGKGSGKMKQEKRMKKSAEVDAMKHMNSTDTPLNTVAMMQQKQRNQSTPYIVLSGGGQTFMSGASTNTDISKK